MVGRTGVRAVMVGDVVSVVEVAVVVAAVVVVVVLLTLSICMGATSLPIFALLLIAICVELRVEAD